jgi:hypothetical protein
MRSQSTYRALAATCDSITQNPRRLSNLIGRRRSTRYRERCIAIRFSCLLRALVNNHSFNNVAGKRNPKGNCESVGQRGEYMEETE